MTLIDEQAIELQAIEWFKNLEYDYKNGHEISPEGDSPERNELRHVILEKRLRSSLIKINPDIPRQKINNSILQILNPNIPDLFNCNRENHLWLTKGFKIIDFEERTGLKFSHEQGKFFSAYDKGLIEITLDKVIPTTLGLNFLNNLQEIFLPSKGL